MHSSPTAPWTRTIRLPLCCAFLLIVTGVPGAAAQVGAQTTNAPAIFVPTHVRADIASVAALPLPPSQRLGVHVATEMTPIVLAPVDVNALLTQGAAGSSPMRVGMNVPAGVALTDSDVSVHTVPGVGTIWTFQILSAGAQGLRLHMTNVDIPRGAELWLYPPDAPGDAQGPLDDRGPQDTGEFWSQIVAGDEVCVEYFLPENADYLGFFVVAEISHIYRGLEPPPQPEGHDLRDAGPCHLDVMCYPDWHPLHNATARIYFTDNTGSYLCTATLLSTVAGDETPYMMTANHCVSDDTTAATVTAYWFYQTESCDGSPATYAQTSNSDMLWTNGSYDITLLMFRGKLPAGVAWAGWDTNSVTNGTTVACISHPAGDRKKITFGYKSGGSTYKYQIYWTDGTIEGGSSGSGIYRESTQAYLGVCSTCVVGTDCDNPEGPCQYGKFLGVYPSIASYLQEGSDDALENNDSCAAAVPLSAGSYTDLVLKRIDDDWYRVTLQPCQEVDAALFHHHAWGDVDIEIYDACGGTVLAADLGDDHNDKLVTHVNDSGAVETVYLHVFLGAGDSDTRNTYDLDISTQTVTAPPALTDVSATDGSLCGQIVVWWTADPSATSYSVWRSATNDPGTATQVDSTTDSYYIDVPPQNEIPYYYWVKSHNGESACGTSDFSNSDSGYSHCDNCFGDLDGDSDVDLGDLATLLGNYGTPSGATYADGDLDGDGDVDLQDLAALLAVYGTVC